MKSIKYLLVLAIVVTLPSLVNAQMTEMQYYRESNQSGVDQFEDPKNTDVEFEEIAVKIGGGLALQFQGLSQETDFGKTEAFPSGKFQELGKNFNLPTANLDLDVQLYDGVRMHLRTFLSSRHHNETYVKGGYLQIDKLDFISEGFLSGLMEKARIRIGQMEINYGDLHFRRSDNGMALYNPFVGNFLMDSYSTELAGEVYYLDQNGLIAMVGLSNGRLNQSVTNTATKPSVYGKIGFDNQDEDLRLRLTASIYGAGLLGGETNSIYLYQGDRAGARYYNVLDTIGTATADFRSGRVTPDMNAKMTSVMLNPFIKAGGLEFLGVAEFISGKKIGEEDNRNWTQLGAELLYRFGASENLYAGARYNAASGELAGSTEKVSVNRLNIGGGWFMTKNVVTKLEYVSQVYKDYPAASKLHGAKFNGFVLEAAIAF